MEAKQDNRRAHNGGNSTKKRKVPDVTVEGSEEFNETMRQYRNKKAAKTRQAIAARTDARHQVMLDSLPSVASRLVVGWNDSPGVPRARGGTRRERLCSDTLEGG